MQINEKMMKPVLETSYLTAENAARYRVILRFFYLQYEKIKYWMNQEEVYLELITHPEFQEYTMDKCRQDLDSLVNWKNMMTVQDTKKVMTIEAFRNRQYRYQLSDYSVEIERLMIRLEHMETEGASLEPTLLERLKTELSRVKEMQTQSASEIYGWWNNLNNDFIRLNQNYQDYMRDLNSAKAEELMKTKEFLVFKDRLIEYLRSFVKGLQLNTSAIELKIREVSQLEMDLIFHKVVEYEMSIPRLDGEVNQADLYAKALGRWESLKAWFTGSGGRESEASRLFDLTNDNIRKITRYATQISEQFSFGANRKEEYRQLAQVFLKCKQIQEAHKLSAVVFGVEAPIHLKGNTLNGVEENYQEYYSGYQSIPLQIIIKCWNNGEQTISFDYRKDCFMQLVKNENTKIAIYSNHGKITYQEFNQRIVAAIRHLERSNICSGSRVILLMENSVDYIVYAIASLIMRAVIIPLELNTKLDQLEYINQDCNANLIITSSDKKEFEKYHCIKPYYELTIS